LGDNELKVEDKTLKEWNDLVEEWHNDWSTDETLEEHLGLSEPEYNRFMHGEGLHE
jgi:hypothetical protein